MTQEQRIIALAQAVAADIKILFAQDGNLSSLTTTAKGNLVAAINELKSSIASASSISDGTTTTSSTWSSTKINSAITAAISALVASAPTALDTLKELADALGDDPNYAATVTAALGKRVRVDAVQTFTTVEQAQGCANLGIGNPDSDFVSTYNTAKNS